MKVQIMKLSRYNWCVLLATTITQMCAALSTQGFGVLAGFLQHDFALSNSEVGLLASTLNIAPIFGLFLIGRILDYAGERLLILLGMLVIGISTMLMSFANHYWILLITLFFCGIGYSPIQPGGSKAIYTWFSPSQRGFAMGFRQAAIPLGGALSAIVFPYIIHYSNWRYAVIFSSIFVFISGVFFFYIYNNSSLPVVTKRKSSFKNISKLFLHKQFRRISMIGIVLVTIQTFILIFWMLFIHHRFSIPLISCAWYLFAIQVFGTLGRTILSTWGSFIEDGYRRIIFLIIIMLSIILITILYLPNSTNHFILMFVSCVLGFFSFGWYGPWIVWLSESSNSQNIGTTLSIGMALNQIAIVITPILFGRILDVTRGYLVSWICIIILASIVLIKELFHI